MRTVALLIAVLFCVTGCRSTYYAAWEKFGWEKRDILADRVEDARDAQQDASEEFKTTLQRFKELTQFEGGKLESVYNKLSSQYEQSESKAKTVTDRIDAVDQVAKDMFSEWEKELEQYQNRDLRSRSEKQLRDTRSRYGELLSAMRKAEGRMPPVLAQFKDQVLFLKHNLNASAIASLQGTTSEIELDVNQLIKEMDAAIEEANQFIGTLK